MMGKWSIRFQIVFVISLVITLSVGYSFNTEQQQMLPYNNNEGRICQRINIWSWEDMENVRGCSVIEGSLQINMVFQSRGSSNISFPELREITGFLMAFSTPNMMSLKNLFPNLAVIRGQELVEDYALVVFKMTGMEEIGLPSLTNILRGSVWIVDNENLCYVDTIDWSKITNESSTDGINKNKQQCPDTCPQCPRSDIYNERNLCWSKDHCQIVPTISCAKCGGRPCYGDKSDLQCCHRQCLGGCFGPKPNECHVCKGVVVNRPGEGPICSDKCPAGFYEYLKRRCVSQSECLNITATAPVNHPTNPGDTFSGKWHTAADGTQMCVLECPKDTVLAPNGTACIPCVGTCKKNCPGRTVDSIETARELNGCTRITGALKIHIRRSSSSTHGTIVKELKENLDKIEEIDHYLAVTYTYSIYSLDFLSNLRVIKGKELDDKKYAVIVKSNENLMELWNGTDVVKRKVIIENKNAHVLFHYNPKLCLYKIWEFIYQAEIKPPANDDKYIDIGVTNGDHSTCNTKKLKIQLLQKSNSTVQLQWENFRRNLTLTSHLLNYEIHYKEAPGYPKRNESKFGNRDPCGDDGWNVQEQAKISDNEVKGVNSEPEWENEALIANLNSYTTYALYVKAIVIQDAYALNNNTGAESDILYFRTYADNPRAPEHFRLASSGQDKITVTWEPPLVVNGELSSFKIWMKSVPENQEQQDQRNYCKEGRAPIIAGNSKLTDSFISTTFSPMLQPSSAKDGCCSCSAPPPSKPVSKDQIANNVYAETIMLDTVMGKYVFTDAKSSPVFPSLRSDDDPKSNDIRKSRRRRWARDIREPSSASDEVAEPDTPVVIFPEGAAQQIVEDKKELVLPMENGQMVFTKEIPYNSSISKWSFVLENLTHYTTYYIGIQACRAVDPDIVNENDTRTCSEIINEIVKTAPSPTADTIPGPIAVNLTDNKIHARWNEPLHPNGVVLAYVIALQKVGTSKEEHWDRKCVTHQEFLKNGRNYTYSGHLTPGNYSLKVMVASLAQDSEFSAVQYFYIEDINETSPGFWVLVILLPILIIALIACFVAYYVLKKQLIISGQRIISANPEYMPNVDIEEKWEVQRDMVKLIKELGQGSFGTVFLGKLLEFSDSQPELLCAVKSVVDDTPSEERALFLKEAALMTTLDCHHVVKLLGIVSKTQPIYVIMELMENGDLKQYLRSRRPDAEKKSDILPPTLKQILRMMAEIADGMTYIHSRKLVHRDLAARNCLVHVNLTVKVGDFGMTKEITDYYRKQTRGLLPVRWMAPESLRDGVFTSQTDVWSFGVVLWEMATLAAQPYQGLSNSQVLDFVQSGRVMDMPEKCPQILYELMSRCWQYDHRHRPTFIEILERLTPYLEPSFAQISFYHSQEGIDYKTQASLRPIEEEPVTIRTPLIATFDVSDDELDGYDSDDDHGLNHHIIDDLGDTSSLRLLSTTPVKPLIEPSTSPANKPSLDNGIIAMTPLSISGNNGSHLKNGTSPPYSSVPSNQPTPLISSPSVRTNTNTPTTPTSTPSNKHYTETLFSTPVSMNSSTVPSSNYSMPLTPVKVNDVKINNKSISSDRPINNRSPIQYTSVTPLSQNNTQLSTRNNTAGDTSNSNESSKSFRVNCVGDSHKFGNGTSTGGNGYILPATGDQRNKTTQF